MIQVIKHSAVSQLKNLIQFWLRYCFLRNVVGVSVRMFFIFLELHPPT